MPPASDGTRTVACSFHKLVPDEAHKALLLDAIERVHKATILATELLNMHVRRSIRDGVDLTDIMSANWLLNAYNLVTAGKGTPKDVPELRLTKEECMPAFDAPSRTGLTQLLMYECRNMAAVASTNVWKHYRARVTSYVRDQCRLTENEYKALTKEERRARFAAQLRMAADICRNPRTDARKAEGEVYESWVDEQRAVLGIDAAVGEWGDKPLLYHLKVHPERFLRSMSYLSSCKQRGERKAFALFPLRRTFVPRHVHFDQKALREVLRLGASAYSGAAKATTVVSHRLTGTRTRRSTSRPTLRGSTRAVILFGSRHPPTSGYKASRRFAPNATDRDTSPPKRGRLKHRCGVP